MRLQRCATTHDVLSHRTEVEAETVKTTIVTQPIRAASTYFSQLMMASLTFDLSQFGLEA